MPSDEAKKLAASLGVAAMTAAAPAAGSGPSDRVVAFIREAEGGEREHRNPGTGIWSPYEDAAGKWTIGRGHLINGGDSFEGFANGITDEEVERFFTEDVTKAYNQARKRVGKTKVDSLSPEMQDLFVDFAFNLGQGFAEKFPNMTKAILAGDMETAAKESRRVKGPKGGKKTPLDERNRLTLNTFFGKAYSDYEAVNRFYESE